MVTVPSFNSDAFTAFEQAGWQDVALKYHNSFARLTTQAAYPLLDALGGLNGQRLLDVATGPGYTAAAAAERGANAIGIDFSAAMVAQARQHFPNIPFLEGNAESLPFANESFDAVVMNFGLLHFAKPEQALIESFRVLCSGGRVGFTVWAMPEEAVGFGIILHAIQDYSNSNIPLPPGPSSFHFSVPQECNQALLEAGFKAPTVIRVPLVWRLSSADELFQAMQEGTVRTGGLIRAQTQQVVCAIRRAIHDEVKVFEQDGILELPMPVILATAVKV